MLRCLPCLRACRVGARGTYPLLSSELVNLILTLYAFSGFLLTLRSTEPHGSEYFILYLESCEIIGIHWQVKVDKVQELNVARASFFV